MGKYDHILADLPRLLNAEPDYQSKVDAVKRKIVDDEPRHAAHFALQYAAIRREIDEIKRQNSEANLRLEAYSQLLIDQYEVEGTTSLTLDNGDVIRTQAEPYLIVEDKETFRQWCLKEGLERELHMLWQTANSLAKARLLEGDPEPDGTKAYVRTKIVFTKG